LWSGAGWILSVVFGIAAIFQAVILLNGLARMSRLQRCAEQRLQELERRDAELFAGGKSFDEVVSQYKRPDP
jgi:hypothetical protein